MISLALCCPGSGPCSTIPNGTAVRRLIQFRDCLRLIVANDLESHVSLENTIHTSQPQEEPREHLNRTSTAKQTEDLMKNLQRIFVLSTVLSIVAASLPAVAAEWSRCITLTHDQYKNSFWSNSCNVKLEVTWYVAGDSSGNQTTVRANSKESIDEPKARYDVAACPYPQTARNANGEYWTGWHAYYCK